VAAAAGDVLDHDELPLPDFDHMTVGQLRGRLRTLDLLSLVQLREYEEAHANRIQIVAMLNNRIAKVQATATEDTDSGSPQTTSAGAPDATATATATAADSRVTPATAGPPVDPPAHGGLTNPGQPR
jgi:hypothetical protein